jgi:hypothetical protein
MAPMGQETLDEPYMHRAPRTYLGSNAWINLGCNECTNSKSNRSGLPSNSKSNRSGLPSDHRTVKLVLGSKAWIKLARNQHAIHPITLELDQHAIHQNSNNGFLTANSGYRAFGGGGVTESTGQYIYRSNSILQLCASLQWHVGHSVCDTSVPFRTESA